MQLNEVQDRFKNTMLGHPDDLKALEPTFSFLFSGLPGQLPERLKIYRDNIVGSLTDALAATFPLVQKITGEDFANFLFRTYILRHPPRVAALMHYGDKMSEFIVRFQPASSVPYLADIAEMEWMMNDVYYAKREQSMTTLDLAALINQPEKAILPLVSATALLKSNWPLLKIRDYALGDTTKDPDFQLEQDPTYILVYRRDLRVMVQEISQSEYELLSLLKRERLLNESLESILKNNSEFDFALFLKKFTDLEILKKQ